ncbi:hypothetical protein [Longispora albida]|uniref:hypothetical protein n=1 Tax=Longispora albida TaxID=203523 RepID=UPI0003608C41|nr:hypothetical protein [Longispora albida]
MRHRLPAGFLGRHRRLGEPAAQKLVAGSITVALAGGFFLPLLTASDGKQDRPVPAVLAAAGASPESRASGAPEAASRGQQRTGTRAPAAAAAPAPPAAAPKPAGPVRPESAPVAGLSAVQMNNAEEIVHVGNLMGVPTRGKIVAIATALQESQLLNLANTGSAESLNLPHEGIGWDHDSVGLFQQRPVSGWGSIAECQLPGYAAAKFYGALLRVRGWQNMPVTVAAQTVQGSAFPDHYAKHEDRATAIVAALGG